jgi:hypothetical protein
MKPPRIGFYKRVSLSASQGEVIHCHGDPDIHVYVGDMIEVVSYDLVRAKAVVAFRGKKYYIFGIEGWLRDPNCFAYLGGKDEDEEII